MIMYRHRSATDAEFATKAEQNRARKEATVVRGSEFAIAEASERESFAEYLRKASRIGRDKL